MSLSAGTRVGQYEITALLGAGGMGEVYRARDTKLNRDVALKVLPELFALDPDRLARFKREAQVLASLNHPNIAAIYGFEEGDPSAGSGRAAVRALVLELVEGPTLAERLAAVGRALSGPLASPDPIRSGLRADGAGLSLDEAVLIARQIAEALEAAHEKGIVHRDLKPANIKIRPDGTVKVLDFGLAKVHAGEGAGPALSQLPTVTAGATREGMILGTAAYMSPEQARGKPLDKRTDIWAFGCVLYEMLTGWPAFSGDTISDTIAAILDREPDWSTLPSSTPMSVRRLLPRCLEKDPKRRLHDIADARIELDDTRAGAGASPVPAPAARRGASSVAVGALVWRRLVLALIGVLAIASIYVWRQGGLPEQMFGSTQPRIGSLAVLPLVNLSRDPDQEYFSDGITEALITELAQIQELMVISRSSVMQYKGTNKPMRDIARELKVDAVIEGSVQRSGDRLGINVQLIHAPTDRHLWARAYERDLRDVLSLQREIARAVSDEIKIELAPQEQARLAGARPVVPAAYEAYLRGFHLVRRFIREDVEKGMEYFRQALALDPNYAPAHAGLAYGYIFGLGDWYLPNREVFPKGKEAAGRALAIDGLLAEAHAFLAMARFIHDYDWVGAEQEFRRAIDGNPGSPDAHRWYGAYLGTQGRMEAGLQEIKRALELDPLSAEGNHLLGLQLYVARRYDEAIEQLPRALELDPNYYWAQMVLGQAYEQRRQFAEATAAFQRARQLTGDEGPPEILAGLARSRALAGDRVAAMKFLGELKALMNRRYVSRHDVATVYVALNETQQALDWLEKAYEDRNWWMPWLRVDPRVASLRSERRFQAIVDRMAFPTIGSRDK